MPPAPALHTGALIGVAQFFAAQLGDPTLLDAMHGPQESNPIAARQVRSDRPGS
ncbi:hypothetical protein [Dactylosporangium fulvum]|uniref:Uncharacterized protein n=1 Tax=Dactylosporangium fulvum TaxID=53359 RepID=A0ABY5VPB4_9ACTN|nr:hypothetical protein [Dactylosporangium fulvum]UWP78934.1 hypothetical protein Dfulv_27610 [Dactylosporangium fulvum]